MKETRAEYLPIQKLSPFEGHPYKVLDNEDMDALVESTTNVVVQSAGLAVRRKLSRNTGSRKPL